MARALLLAIFLIAGLLAGCAQTTRDLSPPAVSAVRPGHVALAVANIERSVRWYEVALSLSQIAPVYEITVDNSPLGRLAASLFGADLKRLRIAQLAGKGGVTLEIFELVEPATSARATRPRFGLLHVAVVTSAFDETVRNFRSLEATELARNFSNPSRKVIFFSDPDGNVIEVASSSWRDM